MLEEEKKVQEYWFFATDFEQKHPEESTALLPRPYQHDKWQQIAYNKEIELPDFKELFYWGKSLKGI